MCYNIFEIKGRKIKSLTKNKTKYKGENIMRIENNDYGNWIEFKIDNEKVEIRNEFQTFTAKGIFGDDVREKLRSELSIEMDRWLNEMETNDTDAISEAIEIFGKHVKDEVDAVEYVETNPFVEEDYTPSTFQWFAQYEWIESIQLLKIETENGKFEGKFEKK